MDLFKAKKQTYQIKIGSIDCFENLLLMENQKIKKNAWKGNKKQKESLKKYTFFKKIVFCHNKM